MMAPHAIIDQLNNTKPLPNNKIGRTPTFQMKFLFWSQAKKSVSEAKSGEKRSEAKGQPRTIELSARLNWSQAVIGS